MHKRRLLLAVLATLAGQAAAQSTPSQTPPVTAESTSPAIVVPRQTPIGIDPHAIRSTPVAAPSPALPVLTPAAVAASAPVPAVTTTPGAAGPAVVNTTKPAIVQAGTPAAVVPAVDDPLFPHLPILKSRVAFWTKVFAEWSEHQSVMHSIDNLGRVYTVLDFRADAGVLSPNTLAALKSSNEKQAYAQLDDDLLRLQAMLDRDGRIDPDQLDTDQRHVNEMFADSSDPDRFRNARGSFRVQRGLKERTLLALQTSGRYLPEMERIFNEHQLPQKLTRLPLVESSFNVDAYSKSAAAGLWQFIPASARSYMRLNNLVDDRRDPWVSTDAAARHLADDYAMLGDWPLALTAYNYGRGGLSRALAEVGGTTLTEVIERFHYKRFGFASSNYYAEFLAASDVEHDYRRHFGEITRERPMLFETVNTQHYVPYQTLRRLAGTDDEEFRRLNPAYRDEVVSGRLYVPPGQSIRVPQGAGRRFELAYATLTPQQRFDHQRQLFANHRVARGESLAAIARRYGVTEHQILAASGLSSAKKVRAGRTLRIPLLEGMDSLEASTPEPVIERAEPAHVIKVSAQKFSAAKAERVRTHRVTSGQTLGTIAERYQTTIQALRQLNGFRKADVLRVGSTIKVPLG